MVPRIFDNLGPAFTLLSRAMAESGIKDHTQAAAFFGVLSEQKKLEDEAQKAEDEARRSTPAERDAITVALRKFDPEVLANSTALEIAAALKEKGISVRDSSQGVLTHISRTRKQLLLATPAE